MATYFDEHADLGPVQRRRVAVLGDDEEAVVHATLLRDSGVDAHLGTSPDSAAAAAAEGDGLLCIDPATAVAEADLVVLTRGDAASGPLLDAARPHLVAGTAVVVLDPVALRFGLLSLPGNVDIVLVAPLAAPSVVEREFAAGRGVPAVVSVEQDVSGGALELALSYAKAIGATRAGAIGATVAAAGETVLFGQYAVVGGALDGLLANAFGVLAEAGYPRDLAYIACVHGLHTALERTYGASGDSAETRLEVEARQAGGRTFESANVRETLQTALADVQAGRVVIASRATSNSYGVPTDPSATVGPKGTPLDAAGRRVRRLMPWIAAGERGASHAR